MKGYLLLLAALCAGSASWAQCCCTGMVVQVVLDLPARSNGAWNYTVERIDDAYDGLQAPDSVAQEDRALAFGIRMGCGLQERIFRIIEKGSGRHMDLRVLFVGFDGSHPILRVPFMPGEQEVDLERMRGCAAAMRQFQRDPEPPTDTVVVCGEGRVRMRSRDGIRVLEPLDMGTDSYGAGMPERNRAGHAYCTGGTSTLAACLRQGLDARLPARPKDPVTITGICEVSEEGHLWLHVEQAEDKQIASHLAAAAMNCSGWVPAQVRVGGENRSVRSIVRFSMVL